MPDGLPGILWHKDPQVRALLSNLRQEGMGIAQCLRMIPYLEHQTETGREVEVRKRLGLPPRRDGSHEET